MAWGRTPGEIANDAIKAKRWYGGSIVGTEPGVMGPVFTMRSGGSVGLVGQMEDMKQYGFTNRGWGIFSPPDTNAGETGIGRRRPEFTFYPFGTDNKGNGQITAIIMQEEGVNYQFQLSAAPDFATITSDFTSPSHGYTIDKPFARGETRYARVRAIYPNGNISAWSETKTLTRKPY